jgi:hypothetical protein
MVGQIFSEIGKKPYNIIQEGLYYADKHPISQRIGRNNSGGVRGPPKKIDM